MTPLVTIGVCARNSEAFIHRVFNVIENQDFPHERMELIFVDDGSTDRTLSLIRDFAARIDIQSQVFHHEWQGVGPSRNVIVKHARGKYILWLDTDQILSTNYVTIHVSFMEQNAKTGVCYGIINIPDTNSALYLDMVNSHLLREYKAHTYYHRRWIGSGSATYRVEAIRQIGGFDDIGAAEDVDANIRIMKAGWLIQRAGGIVHETHSNMSSWKDLWDRYSNFGNKMFKAYRKRGKLLFSLPNSVPMGGIVAGLLSIRVAYRVFHKKIVFLLPLYHYFKQSAWCFGFIKKQVFGK
jgi:glycosyltransferase involved in cell wall biosynthesis